MCHATSSLNDWPYSHKNRLVKVDGMGKNGKRRRRAAARKINLESEGKERERERAEGAGLVGSAFEGTK